eukprot:COSAG02_NODE_1_length_108762_cov_456.708287_69_plen_536_part_00
MIAAGVLLKKKKEDAALATFARTEFDSGQVRDDKRHVETVVKARTKWMTTRHVAMEKLGSNKTLDYDANILEGMGHEQMIRTCKSYHLNSSGTTEEVRKRLADLMMRERLRSNAYKKRQATEAGEKASQNADAIIQQFEMESIMHQEEFAGLHGLDSEEQEALSKMEIKKSLGSVMNSSTQTRKALAELQAWHDSFEPIEPPSAHLTTIEQALAGMQPQDWMEMKERGHEGKTAVDTKVMDAIDDIRRNAARLTDLERLIAEAKKDHAENSRKLSALKHQHQRLQSEYERKTEEKDSKQAAVARAKHEAKGLKVESQDEEADWANEERKLEKAEALLQAQVDELKERYEKEIDALHRKHEEIEKHEADLNRKKNEKLMQMQAEVDKQFEERKVAKLEEMLKQALAKEEADVVALRKEIDAEEAKIADLTQKIKDKVASKLALQGEILRLTQQAAEALEAAEDSERAAKRDREMYKELEQERAEFEWYMKHIAPTAGHPPEEKECQAGSDDKFDEPMIDGGAQVEQARLHFVEPRG